MEADRKDLATSAVHIEQAEYVAEQFDRAIWLAGDVVRAGHVHYLAWFGHSLFAFGVDSLDVHADLLPPKAGRDRLAQNVSLLRQYIEGLQLRLDKAQTGALIRSVLHTGQGSLYCFDIVPGEGFVAVRFEPRGAHEADRALSELTTRLRNDISLTGQNPGGWTTPALEHPPRSGDGGPTAEPTVTVEPKDEPSRRVLELCRRMSDPQGLQWTAYCAHGEVVLALDHFGHKSLAMYFRLMTADARRDFYLAFARDLGRQATLLNRISTTVAGGPPKQIVLDVEQGAIFYSRLAAGEYLVGVTLDQQQVTVAQERMDALAAEVTALAGTR